MHGGSTYGKDPHQVDLLHTERQVIWKVAAWRLACLYGDQQHIITAPIICSCQRL